MQKDQVFYTQQAAGFVVPPSVYNGGNEPVVGSPAAGLTNTQLWTKDGAVVAGAVAPASAVDGPTIGISGLIAPAQ